MTAGTTSDGVGFTHAALCYHTQREYLNHLVPFIFDGLTKAHPVLVAVPGPNLAALRDALGDAAAAVTMADMTEVGRNPGWILGGVLQEFVDRHPGGPVRIIGEAIWPGRTAAEYPACLQHEALINVAFGDCEAIGLCPYDAGQLEDSVIADARLTHPVLWEGGVRADSTQYAPDLALDRCNPPLPSSPQVAVCTVRKPTDLTDARSLASRYARCVGLSPEGIADLQLITTELATNSLQHTDSACRLAFWLHDGHLVCEARDTGHFADPLAVRRPPAAGTGFGWGLFLINAIADLVRTHTGAAGTTIHAYLRLGGNRATTPHN